LKYGKIEKGRVIERESGGGGGSEMRLMLRERAVLTSQKISVPEISNPMFHHSSGKEM
jgi:hypothetical protein